MRLWLLWFGLAIPFMYLTIGFLRGDIFYGEMLHATGEFSARLLLITLAATPSRLIFPNARWPRWLQSNRRYLGVATFCYALLHTVVYLDKQEGLATIAEDSLLFEMWTGWIALLLFLLLALTSNDSSVRWLKRRWKKLHRLVHIAAVLTFVHWIFIAFNFVPGIIHFLILLMLEGTRLIKRKR